jgi:cell wall-associated NlpC family hydrolase
VSAPTNLNVERPTLNVERSIPETWFSTQERIAALEREARRWLGTPFFPNSNTPGPRGGVSCQKLVSEIYRGAGFCDVPVPEVPMAHARFSRESLMEKFMADRPEFIRLPPPDSPLLWRAVLPGDLLGFRIYRTIHHMGIAMPKRTFIHALDGMGTIISSLLDATWSSRMAAVWRPVENRKSQIVNE